MSDPELQAGVIARHDSVCAWCKDPVTAWEHTIERVEGRGWVHTECAERIRNHEQMREREKRET